jgi:hypothetical protein
LPTRQHVRQPGKYGAFKILPHGKKAAPANWCKNGRKRKIKMANEIFKKFIQKDVTFQYPKLDQPHRFNSAEGRSEPCGAAASGAAYSVAFDLSAAAAKQFHADLKAHYESCRGADKTLPAFAKVFGFKKTDDGLFRFTAKRNATTTRGTPAKPVDVMEVIEGKMTPLEDKQIWGGSKGHLRVTAFPTKSPASGEGGISLALDAVVVTDVVRGGNDFSDFDIPMAESKPDVSSEFDDFGVQPATTAKPVNPAGQTEDDIDFG